MTTSASDVMLRAAPIVHTPQLARAVQDYHDMMGFEVVQHVTGVLAVLRLRDVVLHLWQRGVAQADESKQSDKANHSDQGGFRPGHHRVAVGSAFEVHAAVLHALKKPCTTTLLGTQQPEVQRLSGPPRLQPWGAWEFSMRDANGNILHLVQWVVNRALARAALSPSAPGRLPGIALPWPTIRNRLGSGSGSGPGNGPGE
jgi:hypothetical protein